MGIALAESKRMSLALPGLALAEQLYWPCRRRDTAATAPALQLALAAMSGIDWRKR